MNRRLFKNVPLWGLAVPVAACAMLAVAMGNSPGWVLVTCAAAALIASVLVAVHHAEVIAYRVGEPFGTLAKA
jgi:Ca2+:H+ antiporter